MSETRAKSGQTRRVARADVASLRAKAATLYAQGLDAKAVAAALARRGWAVTLPRRCSVKCGAAECAVRCERERAPREPEPTRHVPALGPLGDTTLRNALRTAMGVPR